MRGAELCRNRSTRNALRRWDMTDKKRLQPEGLSKGWNRQVMALGSAQYAYTRRFRARRRTSRCLSADCYTGMTAGRPVGIGDRKSHRARTRIVLRICMVRLRKLVEEIHRCGAAMTWLHEWPRFLSIYS